MGVRFLAGENVLLFIVASKSAVAHIWWNVSLGGQAGRHVKLTHPRPSSAEIRNEWKYTSTTPIHPHILNKKIITFYFFFIVKGIKERSFLL